MLFLKVSFLLLQTSLLWSVWTLAYAVYDVAPGGKETGKMFRNEISKTKVDLKKQQAWGGEETRVRYIKRCGPGLGDARAFFLVCIPGAWPSVPTNQMLSSQQVGASETRASICLHAKSLQSCPTLCGPVDLSSPGSSVHGDSPGKKTGVGCHALPPPGDLRHPGIEPESLMSPAFVGRVFTTSTTWEAHPAGKESNSNSKHLAYASYLPGAVQNTL